MVFSAANGTQITINAPDATGNNSLRVTLMAERGTLSLPTTTGVTVTGNNSSKIILTGTQININNVLNGLSLSPTAGGDTVRIITEELTVNNNNYGCAINGPTSNAYAGRAVSFAGDVNGDGIEDLIVGAPGRPASSSVTPTLGSSYVVFGKNNNINTTVNLSSLGTGGFAIVGEVAGDRNGFTVSGAGDVNGDGLDDLIIGAALATANSNSGAGKSYLVFGQTSNTPIYLSNIALGKGGFVINGEASGDIAGRSVSAAGDVNGDGFADLIVGAPYATVNGNIKAGKSYVIYGGDLTRNVTQQGTIGNDILTGIAAADVLVGGFANDTLIGNGTADVLYGGAGDDILAISDLNFKRIDGGGGSDTLRIDMAGNNTINLTTISDSRLQNIERIDITGTGNNTLILNWKEVLNISDSSNTLFVLGNAGDTVNSAGFTDVADNMAGYNRLTFNGATLQVQNGITVI